MSDEAAERRAFWEPRIRRLQGPILVLGASGFLGANLLRTLAGVSPGRARHGAGGFPRGGWRACPQTASTRSIC